MKNDNWIHLMIDDLLEFTKRNGQIEMSEILSKTKADLDKFRMPEAPKLKSIKTID